MARVGAMGTVIEDHNGGEGSQLVVATNSIVEVLADPAGDWVWVRVNPTNDQGYIPLTKLRFPPESIRDGSNPGSIIDNSQRNGSNIDPRIPTGSISDPSMGAWNTSSYSQDSGLGWTRPGSIIDHSQRNGSNIDPRIPTGSISDPSIGAWSASSYSQDSGLGFSGNRSSTIEKKGIDMSGVYLTAAATGDIKMLIELGSSLDMIDLATLETAQSLLHKPEMQGAKSIVELAINKKKTQDKQGKAEHVSEINKQDLMTFMSPGVDEATQKSKNDEYLQAAIKGETLTLLSLQASLNLIELDTLEMAQNILKNTDKEEAKAIVELTMKKKKQDKDMKEKNEASKRVASEIGSTGDSATHVSPLKDDPAPKENERKSKNDEYLEAAIKGDTMKLASLKNALDLIDLDTLEMAQNILKKSDKEDAKVIVEFAMKRKKDKNEADEASKHGPVETKQTKVSRPLAPSHDNAHAQKSDEKIKNDEYLQAAIKGDTVTLASFMSSLDPITLETLKLAQGIINTSGMNDAKPLVEYAIAQKNKVQNQVVDKSTEWLNAAMAGDSQTLTNLLSSKSHIKLETLELAKAIAVSKGDPGVIAITDFAFNQSSKNILDKQTQGGNSHHHIAKVSTDQGSIAEARGSSKSKQMSLKLEFAGETRQIEFDSKNTKPWREAVKQMSGFDVAYALEELDNQDFSSKIHFKDHKLQVFALDKLVPDEDYITFSMDTIKELQSGNMQTVFLDLSGIGRIYIEVDCSSNQGKQFFELCMGIHGFSYKNVEASGTRLAGKPGERIVFPGYKSIKDGSDGNEGLLDDLEENRTKTIGVGTVAKYTAGGGDFVIFTKGNPEAKTNTYIGEVKEGLKVLSRYIKSKSSDPLIIEEVGIQMGSR